MKVADIVTSVATILTVHAHPDDEASKGAPTIARYVAEGHQAVLVCCTGGEEGDILNEAMKRPEVEADLPAVRAAELDASVAAIGYTSLEMLGYRDSGMPDMEANADPTNFQNAPLDEAVERLVRLIRSHRADVIITYADDQQGYRHPDHLKVHDISVPAWLRAGDPNWYPDAGEPYAPAKLYYMMWARRRMLAHHEAFSAIGVESPYDERWFERPGMDHRITTTVDIGPFYSARTQALLAHATQCDPNEKFWFGLPDDVAASAYPYDDYILARSRVPVRRPETDILAGVA